MRMLFFALSFLVGIAHAAHPSEYFNITARQWFYMFYWVDDWICGAGEVKKGDMSRPGELVGAIHFSETELKNGIDCNVHFAHKNNPDWELTIHIKKQHCSFGIPCYANYQIFNEKPKGLFVRLYFHPPEYDAGKPAWIRLDSIILPEDQ